MGDLERLCWSDSTTTGFVYSFEKQPTFFQTGGMYKLKYINAGQTRDQDVLWAVRNNSIVLQTIFRWPGENIAEYPDYPTSNRPIWTATYNHGDTTLTWNQGGKSIIWVAVACFGTSIRT